MHGDRAGLASVACSKDIPKDSDEQGIHNHFCHVLPCLYLFSHEQQKEKPLRTDGRRLDSRRDSSKAEAFLCRIMGELCSVRQFDGRDDLYRKDGRFCSPCAEGHEALEEGDEDSGSCKPDEGQSSSPDGPMKGSCHSQSRSTHGLSF